MSAASVDNFAPVTACVHFRLSVKVFAVVSTSETVTLPKCPPDPDFRASSVKTTSGVASSMSTVALAEGVSGPVERVWLERSFHVATLDYDREQIFRETVAFVADVT